MNLILFCLISVFSIVSLSVTEGPTLNRHSDAAQFAYLEGVYAVEAGFLSNPKEQVIKSVNRLIFLYSATKRYPSIAITDSETGISLIYLKKVNYLLDSEAQSLKIFGESSNGLNSYGEIELEFDLESRNFEGFYRDSSKNYQISLKGSALSTAEPVVSIGQENFDSEFQFEGRYQEQSLEGKTRQLQITKFSGGNITAQIASIDGTQILLFTEGLYSPELGIFSFANQENKNGYYQKMMLKPKKQGSDILLEGILFSTNGQFLNISFKKILF